jgi:hypothetical protein
LPISNVLLGNVRKPGHPSNAHLATLKSPASIKIPVLCVQPLALSKQKFVKLEPVIMSGTDYYSSDWGSVGVVGAVDRIDAKDGHPSLQLDDVNATIKNPNTHL